MKINREEFLSILQKIKPGLARKEITEQATHFIFTGKKIITYNDHISIQYPFKSDFECSVPADELYRIISEIDSKELDINLKEDTIQFQTKNVKVKLSAILEINKALLIEPEKNWKALPDDFVEGISFCSFSASKDNTHVVLTCLNITDDLVSSSDNYRITQYTMNNKIADSFLISANIIKELIKFPIIKYSLSDAWIFFKTVDNVIFSCRRIEGTFPDVSPLLQGKKGQKIKFPEEIIKGIEVSSILASDEEMDSNKKITVNIKDGKLTCIGEKEIGKIEFTIKDDSLKDKDITFSINPDFFLKILSSVSSARIEEGKLLFISQKFRHLISLF